MGKVDSSPQALGSVVQESHTFSKSHNFLHKAPSTLPGSIGPWAFVGLYPTISSISWNPLTQTVFSRDQEE